ncbi:MAG TPA: SHD1 domain-containing protein, partial [Haloferula sp.]
MKATLRNFTPFVAALTVLASLDARTWTDIQGRKIEAEYVSSTDTDVTLKLASGKDATLPLTKLSAEDQAFIKDAAAGGGDKAAPKPAEKEGDGLNFDDPWPQTIRFTEDPQIKVVTEDKEQKRFIYESAHYRFVCDVRLSQQVVKGFSVMFESTYQYCRALPLAISGGKMTDGKYQILLFETKDSYVQAGGPPTSAGVFMPGKNMVMVPLTSLG